MNILLLGVYEDYLIHTLSINNNVTLLSDRDDDELLRIIKKIDGIIIRSPHCLTDIMLDKAKKVKWIIRAGSGKDNISLKYLDLDIPLFLITGMNSRSVAELVFAMILSLSRELNRMHDSFKNNIWLKNSAAGREIKDRNIGIIGFGNIGQIVADIAYAMGLKIFVNDHSIYCPEKKIKLDSIKAVPIKLNDLLKISDIIVLAVPLCNETFHLLSEKEFNLLKHDVIIINVSRGGVLKTEALYNFLVSHQSAGAGIDVYEKEPPLFHPLLNLKNIICTPHIGAQTIEARKKINDAILNKIEKIKESEKNIKTI